MLSGPFARNVATRCEHTTTTTTNTSSTTTSTNTRHRHYHHYHRSRNMASSHPAIQLQQHSQGLPSITSLTNDLPKPAAPISPEGQSLTDSGRDSGTWPQPQSKRKSPTTTTPTPNPAHMAHCYWKLPWLLPSAGTCSHGDSEACIRGLGIWLPHALHCICASTCIDGFQS